MVVKGVTMSRPERRHQYTVVVVVVVFGDESESKTTGSDLVLIPQQVVVIVVSKCSRPILNYVVVVGAVKMCDGTTNEIDSLGCSCLSNRCDRRP